MLYVKKLSKDLGLELIGEDIKIEKLLPLEDATEKDISLFIDKKYFNMFKTSRAKAFFILEDIFQNLEDNIKKDKVFLILKDKNKLIEILNYFLEYKRNLIKRKKSKISPKAKIGENVYIGQGVIIEDDVVIYPNVYIEDGVFIGKETIIYPNVYIGPFTQIGKKVTIHSGSVIGKEGFGFLENKIKLPHIGEVIIEDNVHVGANVCIDRGTIGFTLLEKNVKVDNLVQIAHNVKIKENTILVSQVGIAGSTKIGKNCILAGQVGVAGHLKITDNVIIGAKSGVSGNIRKPGIYASGIPVFPIKKYYRVIAFLRNIDKIIKLLRKLKKFVDKGEN